MDKTILSQLKKIRAENLDRISKDAKCSLCGRKKGDFALLPINKLFLTRSSQMYIPVAVVLSYHAQQGLDPLVLCDKCHYCYHCFSILPEVALDEWREDTLFWKGTENDRN